VGRGDCGIHSVFILWSHGRGDRCTHSGSLFYLTHGKATRPGYQYPVADSKEKPPDSSWVFFISTMTDIICFLPIVSHNLLLMTVIYNILSAIADILTIIASGIAIYIFLFKRDKISSVIKVLLNYSSQIALSELNAKIERLNDLNANEPSEVEEITCIFNDIAGQIRGNLKLKQFCSEILSKLEVMTEKNKKITEPRKRAIISELREKLRHAGVNEIDDLIGGKNE
jgi:hypothetical protein